MSLSPAAYQLLLVYTTYVIAAGSPGPSNMRIMGVAMNQGRKAGLMFAAGVVTGSIFWGLMAATGVSAILTRFAEALIVLKIFGGLYLLYLAFKAARAAMTSDETIAARATSGDAFLSGGELYRRGLLLHRTGNAWPWHKLVVAAADGIPRRMYNAEHHHFLRLCHCVLYRTHGAHVSTRSPLDRRRSCSRLCCRWYSPASVTLNLSEK
jgi:preprotein translocase subunit SecG